MKKWVCGILLLSVLSGCSKDKTTESDNVFPVITLNNPVNGQNFAAGQTIPINGTISDNNYLAEVHLHVSNSTTGTLLMDVHLYPAAANTVFNQSITATAGVNYKIQVIAKDKNVNESRSTVEVTCN